MTKIFSLIFLSLLIVSCNKGDSGSGSGSVSCQTTTQAEVSGTNNDCTLTGDTNGGTSGGTTGGTTGNTTSGTDGSSSGGTTGGTSGGTTGGTSGGTTGGTSGGTTGGTTGGTSGGTTGGTTGSTTGGTSGGTTGGATGGTGLPNEAYTFDSNILFIGTTATEQAKFDKAVEIIKKVVATEEFRSQILNFTYNGVKTFVDNGGYTNAQIYQKILDAAEKLVPAKNNAIDMEVELYYEDSNVVGYTNGSTKRIWVNNKYFVTNAVTGVASNLFHEWLHKVGFGHAVNYSVSRDSSVPYAVGRIVGSIGKQFD